MHSSFSIEILRDREAVFEFTTGHVAEWSEVVVSDEVLRERPGVVGTTFRTVTEDHGCRMEFEGTVTEHRPPESHAVSMKGQRFDMEVRYTFGDLGDRTLVTQESEVMPKGGMKVFFALFGWMMKRSGCEAARKELENLKRLLEGGSGAADEAPE